MLSAKAYMLAKDLASEIIEGGPGSGNWGHKGRPGHIGGSAARGTGVSAHAVGGGEKRVYSRDMAIRIKKKGFTSGTEALVFLKQKYPGQPADRYERALTRAGLGGSAELAAPRSPGTILRVSNILKTAGQGQTKPLGGGVTETFIVDVDGVKGVFKKMSNRATQEVVAHGIDRALGFGVTPPTVFRTFDVGGGPEKGSVMHFVEGVVAAKFSGKFRTLDMAKITALDFVIGNQDRHPDNFIIDKNGKAWAIDNAFAFGKAKNIVSSTFPAVIDKPIPSQVRAGLKRFVALRKSLEPKIAATLGSKEYAKAVFDRATELAGMTHFPKERYSFYQTWRKKHGGYTPEKVRSMTEGSQWLRKLLSTSTTFRRISR